MASITKVLRTDKKNKEGKCPIHFRIIKNRKVTNLSTGISILEKYWDKEQKKIRSSYSNSKRVNSRLNSKYAEVESELLKEEEKDINFNVKNLKNILRGEKSSDFIKYAEQATEKYLEEKSIGTYDKNKSIIKKVSLFMSQRPLEFSELTYEFLNRYESYLRVEKNNKTSTIEKDFKYIRKLVNDAIREGLLNHDDNPFIKYKIKRERVYKEYLTEEELENIDKLRIAKKTKLALHRDMFLFSCWCGGIRISDLLQLTWKNFDGAYLHLNVMKTTSQIQIKLPKVGLEIIKKYKPRRPKGDEYIFPALPKDLKRDDPREMDTAISRVTAHINKNLKIIAARAKIEKRVSTQTARHTWSTRALRKGMPIEYVSKLMAHSNIRQTLEYAKIVNEELDKAMDVFND